MTTTQHVQSLTHLLVSKSCLCHLYIYVLSLSKKCCEDKGGSPCTFYSRFYSSYKL